MTFDIKVCVRLLSGEKSQFVAQNVASAEHARQFALSQLKDVRVCLALVPKTPAQERQAA